MSQPCLELDISTGLPIDADISLGGIDLTDLSVIFPGGLQLGIDGPHIPNPGDVSGKLLAKVNAALMPLVPLFDIIDALLSVKIVFDAVVTLSPFKISTAIEKLVVKLDKLKRLLPQLSIPCLIGTLVTVLIVYLVGLRAEIKAIIDAQARIDSASARAAELGSVTLAQMASCASANLSVQISAARNNGRPLNRLIAILNQLSSMVGLPQVPPVTVGADMEAALDPLNELIQALTNLRSMIPC